MSVHRLIQQPPPDEFNPSPPPNGYRWEWVEEPPDEWRLATPGEMIDRHCRRPGCRRDPAVALRRWTHSKRGLRFSTWWLYCSWHMYGRRLEGGRILRRRAVLIEPEP